MSESIIAAFRDAMRADGLATDERIDADGKIHRCHIEGDRPGSKNGSYCLHWDGLPAGWYGTHKGGWQTYNWCTKRDDDLSAPEREANKRRQQIAQAARQKEEARRHDEAARKARTIWERATTPAPADHPYLARKAVASHGLRAATWRRWEQADAGEWQE